MSTIEPKKTLYVDYPVPPTQRVLVRVAASDPVNVYIMDKTMLEAFLDKKVTGVTVPNAIGVSQVSDNHTLQVRLPVLERWFLVIDNPWDRLVDVEYTVVALALAASNPYIFGTETVTHGVTGYGDELTATLARRRRLAK